MPPRTVTTSPAKVESPSTAEISRLGEFDSPQSKAKYYALLAEYNANGKKMPDDAPLRHADAAVSVRCVTADFRQHADIKYANNQLRYTAATAVRDALGIETAQALLGHSHVAMTEHDAQQSESKAILSANALPGLGESPLPAQ